MGATWLRRGSRSSVGHTEGQSTSQIQLKKLSRKRRKLRPGRLRSGLTPDRSWAGPAQADSELIYMKSRLLGPLE